MAWFGRNKNEDDQYSTYGRMGYSGHPVIQDSDGRKHPVVGYTATHNSQRYVAKTEQLVRYHDNVQGFPAMRNQKYSPPRKEVYKDHGDGDKPHHDRPDKTSEFSRDESKNFPWNNIGNSPQYRTSHHDYGKHTNFNNNNNDEDDDVICNDGVCFENPRKWSKSNYFKDENNINENEKHKGNGYNPPTYTVPISFSTQPKKDTYYNNNSTDQKEKGNNYSPRKFPPIITQPRSRDQGYQQTIDSTEARRRYGMAMPGTGTGTGSGNDEEKYTRTIDSNEAARLYDGVLLPN